MEGTNRIKLNDEFRIALFQNIHNKNISPSKLCERLNCSYSALKKWRNGSCLIPENCLSILLSISDYNNSDAEANITSILPRNWGQELGGLIFTQKYKNQLKSRLAHARNFIKQRSFQMPEMDCDLWEVMGILLGDGCLSKYFATYDNRWIYETNFTGNMYDDLEFYKYRVIPILRDKFHFTGNYIIRKNCHCISIRMKGKNIFEFFKKHGMPVGKKKKRIRISKEILNSSYVIKAAVLRGLLDTDGHIFARKDEKYKYPHLEISSGSAKFLNDIKSLMNEFGLPAYIHLSKRGKRIGGNVLIRGRKNLRLWMDKIGSSHPVHINRYNTWLSTGKLLPKGLLAQR
jgi:hypothetical protein